MTSLIKYIVGSIFLIVFDQLWMIINHDSQKKVIEKIQKKQYNKKYIPYILANIFLTIHFILLVYHKSTIINGAIHGFILYGIINSYNYAYFEDYDLHHALIETIYGTFIIIIALYIVKYIEKFNLKSI